MRLDSALNDISDLANEHGFPLWSGIRGNRRALSRSWSTGRQVTCYFMLRRRDENRAMGHAETSPQSTDTRIAEGRRKLVRWWKAENMRDAEQLIETNDERHHEAEVHRLQGDLLRMVDDNLAAERSYHRALAVANRQSAKTHEHRGATSMARLSRRDQGKQKEARELSSLRSAAGLPKALTLST